MILVADSSALIALSSCNCLNLLDLLFEEVRVPLAVYNEVIQESKNQSDRLKKYLINKIIKVDFNKHLIIQDGTLDQGELEAIILYKELKANRLLIDDKRGRKIAEINDVKIIGSLGVLLLGKKKGHIPDIKSRIELMQMENIYFSNSILKQILFLAGE